MKGHISKLVLIPFFLTACGGSTKPAEDPSSESTESTEAAETPAAAEGEAPATEKSSDSKETAPPSGGEVTEEERKAAFQLVLEDEELGKYLQLGQPGRFPLKISGKDLPTGLTKMSKPVEYIDTPEPKAPVLVITDVQIGKEKATISYRYDIEGIKGTTTLQKGPRGWEILRSRIVEHFRADPK